jgi:hypothetical protein
MGAMMAWQRNPLSIAIAALIATWAAIVTFAFVELARSATPSLHRVALVACALPFVLTAMVALLLRGQDERATLDLFAPPGPQDAPHLQQQALALWAIEAESNRKSRGERDGYLLLFGLVTSLALLSSALVFALKLHGAAAPQDPPGTMALVVVGIVAGTVMSFAISLGQIVVRAARQDLAPRLVGSASRSILVVILTTAIVIGFSALGTDKHAIDSYNEAVLAGLVAGLVGDQLIDAIAATAGLMTGAVPADDAEDEDAFHFIDGIENEHRQRLAELGITSAHALAYGSTPALFFSTRYDLQEICDWQDQALLVVLAGLARAKEWRPRLGVRGCADARSLAGELLDPAAQTTLHDLRPTLGYASDADATVALTRIRQSDDIARLAYWSTCSPVPPAHVRLLDRGHQATG